MSRATTWTTNIPTPSEKKGRAYFRNFADRLHEGVYIAAFVLRKFDHEQRFDPYAQGLQIDLGMKPAKHADVPEPLHAFMRR